MSADESLPCLHLGAAKPGTMKSRHSTPCRNPSLCNDASMLDIITASDCNNTDKVSQLQKRFEINGRMVHVRAPFPPRSRSRSPQRDDRGCIWKGCLTMIGEHGPVSKSRRGDRGCITWNPQNHDSAYELAATTNLHWACCFSCHIVFILIILFTTGVKNG